MKRTLILLLLVAAVVHAQNTSKVGTTAAKFLSIPAGTRALGLGGAFVSMADDPTAMYWNPAGIARLTQNAIVFDHANWLADMSYNYAGFVLPFGNMGSLGLNVTTFASGDMDVTTEDFPEGTGETFNATSYAFGVTYAKNLTDWFSIGANAKYVTEQIWHNSSSGMAVDIGTLFNTPFYGIRFGASISNFGTKLQMNGEDLIVNADIDPSVHGNNGTINSYLATDKFDMPLNLRIGISRDFIQTDDQLLTLAVDAVHPNDNTESVNLGMEYQMFNRIVALRAGYKSLFQQDSPERLTLGAGINYGLSTMHFSFDYGFEYYDQLSGVHKFAVGLIF